VGLEPVTANPNVGHSCQTIHFRIRRPTRSAMVILSGRTRGAQISSTDWSMKYSSKARVVPVLRIWPNDVPASAV
jgi:hypothetical protein